jgi:hypothetical protein
VPQSALGRPASCGAARATSGAGARPAPCALGGRRHGVRSLTFCSTNPATSFTPSTAWSRTVEATRVTRATGPRRRAPPPEVFRADALPDPGREEDEEEPPEPDATRPDDFRADDFRAEDLPADDLPADDLPADDFRADDFRADVFRADVFRADVFRADVFRAVEFRAPDPRADDPRFAADERVPVADFRADAPRAEVFRADDLPAEDFRAEDFRADEPRDDEARELDPEPRALPDRPRADDDRESPDDDLRPRDAVLDRAPPELLFERPPLRELLFLVAMVKLLMKEGVRRDLQNPRTSALRAPRAPCMVRRAWRSTPSITRRAPRLLQHFRPLPQRVQRRLVRALREVGRHLGAA